MRISVMSWNICSDVREKEEEKVVVIISQYENVTLGNGITLTHCKNSLQLTKHSIQAQPRKSGEPGKKREKESVGRSS